MLAKHIRFWSRYALKRDADRKVNLSEVNAKLTSNPDDEFIRALLALGARHRDPPPRGKKRTPAARPG